MVLLYREQDLLQRGYSLMSAEGNQRGEGGIGVEEDANWEVQSHVTMILHC